RQRSRTSGRKRNRRANSKVVTMSDTNMLTPLQSSGTLGAYWASQPFRAASAAVTARDTINRNPIATTKPNEPTRSIRKALGLVLGLGFPRQIVFSAP